MTFNDWWVNQEIRVEWARYEALKIWNESAKAEREECAKIADSFDDHIRQYTTDVPDIGGAIRNRPNPPETSLQSD